MVHYLKNPKGGRPIPLDYKTGKIKEEHDSWYDPQKPPEAEPKEKWSPPIPNYEHPPKYLVPKGNGFYGDPDEPADPQDCDGPMGGISPWCGANPFSKQPLALNPEVKWDECNVWVQFSPVVSFVKFRPVTLTYRFPGECRNEPPPPPPPPAPKPGEVRVNYPTNIDADLICYAFVSHTWTIANLYGKGEPDTGSANWSSYRCPGDTETRNGVNYNCPVTGFGTGVNGWIGSAGLLSPNQANSAYRGAYYAYGITSDGLIAYQDVYTGLNFTRRTFINNANVKARIGQFILTWTQQTNVGVGSLYIYEGRYGSIIDYLRTWTVQTNVTLTINVDIVVRQDCNSPFKDKDKLPPPPDKPKKDCCMDCTQQNDLLRQILAEAQKARQAAEDASDKATQASEDAAQAKDEAEKAADEAKKAADEATKANQAIGTDEFPATLPEGLSSTRPGMVTIKNIPQFLKQQIIYLDELIGEVPVTIKIQDSDLIQEGEQPIELTFDNITELHTEHLGYTINTSINSELMVQLITKALIELTVLRKQLHTLQSSHEALVQYEGYDVRESFEEVPFSVTPNIDNEDKFSISQFLKESTQKVEIAVLEEKEIGRNRKFLLFLEKAGSVILTVFWRKLDQGKDLVSQIQSIFNQQNQVINDIDTQSDDLEEWLKEYEEGFTNSPGYEGDRTKPWGDDYEARPKTKIIKKTDPPNMKG